MSTQEVITESIAKVLIIDNEDRCLVLTLGEHRKYPEKSFGRDFPGGIVDASESERDAAIREVNEECGIELASHDLSLVYSETGFYKDENKSITRLLYVARLSGLVTISLSWEHSSCEWLTLDALHALELRPFFGRALDYLANSHLL